MIIEFQGEYRWLSNFWPSHVRFGEQMFPTVENAYQASKFEPHQRAPFLDCTPGQAKRLSRELEWDDLRKKAWMKIRVSIMRNLIEQKFKHGTELADKLLQTGHQSLIEGNSWGDTFWGVCNGKGKNKLGMLLMQHRHFLMLMKQGFAE